MRTLDKGLDSLRTHIAQAHEQKLALKQEHLEGSVAGLDGLDEVKVHGAPKALPTGLRVRDALSRTRNALPTAGQVCAGARVAGKFAAAALPLTLAGGAIGAANHYISRVPETLFFDAPIGDPHAMAWAGAAAGLVGAGLVATERYHQAAALGAALLAGTAGNGVGLYLGGVLGAVAGGLASVPVNMTAWLLKSSLRVNTFEPVFRVAEPLAQALCGLGAAAATGAGVYNDLRPLDEAQAPERNDARV